MPRALGVDVSHWKPVLDWSALKASGVSFVGIKATEGGSYIDSMLDKHIKGFRQSDFLLGIYYHFARSGDPVSQAKHLCKIVGPLEKNERLCLDLEVPPDLRKIPGASIDWVKKFYGVILEECSDRKPIIYTSNRIWRMVSPQNDQSIDEYFSKIDLWAPRYNDRNIQPEAPSPWKTKGWTFWQWSDGSFPPRVTPGVGRCDTNWFRGNEEELKAYADSVFPKV
jgi:lysozyme